jgi:hypothetical protein
MSYLQPYQNIISGNHYQKYELCDTEKDKRYGPKNLFGSKWEALIREWIKLLDGELQDLYSLLQQNKMGGACGTYAREASCVQGFGREA